jgi:glycolate oxidase
MEKIPILMRSVQEISDITSIPAMKYGHIGDGNLHVAWFINIADDAEYARLERAADMIYRAAIELGGTVSSEHGIGRSRAAYMEMQWGSTLDVMRAIKHALDHKGILNPGKLGL